MRHPQCSGFLLIMVGFLLQWPTIPTLVMFPVLLCIYRRLAIREEREVAERFRDGWGRYASKTSRFVPRGRRASRPRPTLDAPKEPGGVGSSYRV